MKRVLAMLVLVLGVFGVSGQAHATHFRFGHISWQRIDPASPRKVRFTITQVYRWSYPVAIDVPFMFGDGTSTNLHLTDTPNPPVGQAAVIAVNSAEDFMVTRIVVDH